MKLPYKQWKKLDRAMAFLDETVNEVPMGIRIEPEAPSLIQLSAEMWELIDELKPEEGNQMSVELTFKRESKELETALEVVRNLINVSRNQIKSEPENGIFQEELYQLQAVEDIIEYADFYYKD